MERRMALLAIGLLLTIFLPDNTEIQIPDEVDLKKFLCAMDNTYCHDDKKTAELYGNPNRELPPPNHPGLIWRF